MIRIFFTALLAAAVTVPVQAEFSGKGELGLIVNRGNTESETANSRLELTFTRERWTNESMFSGVYARDRGETNASRFLVSNKTDYALNERSYVLGALRYDRDRFSGFKYQTSASLGYGYRLIMTEQHQLKVELGPGVRYSERRETEETPAETETEMILRGFIDYRWQVSETTEFTNRLLAESSDDNTLLENTLGLSVAINSRLSLKTGVSVRHNTRVDPERKKTDTLMTVNLVYQFPRR